MQQFENTSSTTLEGLIIKFKRGDYTSKYPKSTLWNTNHIVDEDLSIKENRRLVQEHNDQVKAQAKNRRDDQNRLDLQLHTDMCQYLQDNHNLNAVQCSTIVTWVYNMYHSNMFECFEMLDPIAGLCGATILAQED